MSGLDNVTVRLSRGDVVLLWEARDRLLDEVKHLDSAHKTVEAFNAVGASTPVRVPIEGTGLLVEAINLWSQNVTVDVLPEGVWDLRCALIDDLYDAGR